DRVRDSQALALADFVMIDGKQTLVGAGYLDRLGWYNVTLMDVEAIIDRRLFLPIGLLLAGIVGLIAIALMLIFKRTVLDRIQSLEEVVRSARQGNFGPALTMSVG